MTAALFKEAGPVAPAAPPRVLLLEDCRPLCALYGAWLRRAGCEVEVSGTLASGRAQMERGGFDVVLSDLWLPDGVALGLLGELRRADPTLQFLLLTGAPSVDSAIDAIECGVHRYLRKPVTEERLVAEVREAAVIGAEARWSRELLEQASRDAEAGPAARRRLDEAMDELWLAAQPIVSASRREAVAYELLLRSGRTGPLEILQAAEQQHRTLELGRRVRAAAASLIHTLPEHLRLFVNLHPDEVLDPEIGTPADPLSACADRITLELTERARLDASGEVDGALARLRGAGYRLAIDDLGCGYSGLSCFALLGPNVVKLDRSLIQGVDGDRVRAAVVRAVVDLCRETCIEVVAEGVETVAERDCLIGLGCDLLQGYLFGRPARGFGVPTNLGPA